MSVDLGHSVVPEVRHRVRLEASGYCDEESQRPGAVFEALLDEVCFFALQVRQRDGRPPHEIIAADVVVIPNGDVEDVGARHFVGTEAEVELFQPSGRKRGTKHLEGMQKIRSRSQSYRRTQGFQMVP